VRVTVRVRVRLRVGARARIRVRVRVRVHQYQTTAVVTNPPFKGIAKFLGPSQTMVIIV